MAPFVGRFDLAHHPFVHVSAREQAGNRGGRCENSMLSATHETSVRGCARQLGAPVRADVLEGLPILPSA